MVLSVAVTNPTKDEGAGFPAFNPQYTHMTALHFRERVFQRNSAIAIFT